uniref:AAA+ ATPase domain-containing protein n=1 Tax=Panagrolaimus sp. JU765 TaxID=591449 RepID=A0AC34QGT6_9BILA
MGQSAGRPAGRRQTPQHAAQKVARKLQKNRGPDAHSKLPQVIPRRQCLLRLLKLNRIHDYLLLEQEFIQRQNASKPSDAQRKQERKKIAVLRGTPTTLARIHELFNDEQHAVVVVEGSKREWYVPILSIVDKDLICLNALVLVKAGGSFKNVPLAVVGVLQDSVDSRAMVYKLEKAPKESFDDIGGLEAQIQEIKEAVELPLTHPEYYEEMGITAPKGVILYGEPGTGKTLLAKAVAHSTSATFLRATGSDLVQKSSGEGARLVRELFKMAKEYAPCIVFLDEIDAAICTEAGMLALRAHRKVVCMDDFERAVRNVIMTKKFGVVEEFYL